MNTKRTTSIYAVTNNKIDSLRAFLSISKEMYHSNKIDLTNSDFLEWLKFSCYEIEQEMIETITYYQHNKASLKTIETAKDKCKDLSILLNKYKLELLSFGFGANEYTIYKKELKDAFDFELTKNTKELLPNYLDIRKEFSEFINIETLTRTIKHQSSKDIQKEAWFEIGLLFAKGEIQKQYELTPSYPKTASKLGFSKEIHTALIKATMANYQSHNKQKNIYSSKKYMTEIFNYCIDNNIEMCNEFKVKYTDLVNITTF